MSRSLHTEHLSIGHAGRTLLANIELELKAGEMVALLGVNGIGKSTLLRTLAGLHSPLQGHVFIGDQDIHRSPAVERARSVSIVLTGRPPSGTLDVWTIVGLARNPWTDRWGTLSVADHQAVDDALRNAGAEHLRHRALSTCSDGECQKVMIARALAQTTPVLLLDEPTAFLDLPNRVAIVRLLRTIARSEGKAVLFSTHDLQLALDLCDRIVLMQADGALWQGAPAEAIASGRLERAFAGSGIQFDPIAGTHRFTA